MSETVDSILLRGMSPTDVPDVLDVQEPGAVLGLSDVFPQDAYPFPRDDVARRWQHEIAMPGIACYVVLLDGTVVGFAATRSDEFMHFGIAVEHWGTGIAQAAHDAVIDRMRRRGVQRAWLRVFTANGRGRFMRISAGIRPANAPTVPSRPTRSCCGTNAPLSGIAGLTPRSRAPHVQCHAAIPLGPADDCASTDQGGPDLTQPLLDGRDAAHTRVEVEDALVNDRTNHDHVTKQPELCSRERGA